MKEAPLAISSLASTVVITELDSDGQPISSREVGGATSATDRQGLAAGDGASKMVAAEATAPKRKFAALQSRPTSKLFGQLRAYRE